MAFLSFQIPSCILRLTMSFSWHTQPRPILALSPMADMTDVPFGKIIREVVSEYISHSRLILYREMVSSDAIVRGNDKTLEMTEIFDAERPVVQQIFGNDPETMAAAAKKILSEHHPEAIDINMGCPAHKLIGNFHGAALMKDPERAAAIVKAIKDAVDVPVSVKMRAGWSDPQECVAFAKIIEDAGADLIAVHGRTKTQGYSGSANRDVVAKVKQAVSIPVLYNGDINTWQDFFEAIDQTGCDGALIGRGALGNPWIFAQIEQRLAGEEPIIVTLNDRVSVALKHLNEHLAYYGDDKITTFRKHLSWYFKGVPGFKSCKDKIMTATDKQAIQQTLEAFLHDQESLS